MGRDIGNEKRAKKYGISGNIKNKKKTLKNNENGSIIKSEEILPPVTKFTDIIANNNIIKGAIKKGTISQNKRLEIMREFKSYIDDNIDVANTERSMFGFNSFVLRGDDKVEIARIALKSNDTRPYQYRIKTIFHEIAHTRNHNRLPAKKIDYLIHNKDKYYNLEEVFAESAANYYTKKVYNIKKVMTPSYPEDMVRSLIELKKLPEFKDAKYISDFGEIFVKKYWDKTDAVEMLTMKVGKNAKSDIYEYIAKRNEDLIKNKTKIVNTVSRLYEIDKDKVSKDFDKMINDVKSVNIRTSSNFVATLFNIKGV